VYVKKYESVSCLQMKLSLDGFFSGSSQQEDQVPHNRRERTCAMKESIIGKKILTVMFGLLFIGSAAAILEIYLTAKNTEHPLSCVTEDQYGDIFV
jgi:hypothetical protein